MASMIAHVHAPTYSTNTIIERRSSTFLRRSLQSISSPQITIVRQRNLKKNAPTTVVAAAGDVSVDGTLYLIAGAAAVTLIGTAFPILFSRKDLCPVCDGAGFVRKSESTLKANAARKDQVQIVCANCNGLGKLNQVDK